MFKVEVIDSIEKFNPLREEWDRLLNDSSVDNIFLTWEWQFNWWISFNNGNELRVILVRDDHHKLIGIAPLYLSKERMFGFLSFNELRFIGYGSEATSEYLGFICQRENESDIVNCLLGYINNKLGAWQISTLCDMDETSTARACIVDYIKNRRINHLLIQQSPVCPVVKIQSDWNQYLNGLSRQMRRNISRYSLSKLEKYFTVEVKKYDNIDQCNGAFQHFKRLYADRRRERKEDNKYENPDYVFFQENITKSLSDKGWLYLCLLSLNKEIAAAQYYFKYNNKLYFYHMGADEKYAKYSVSQALLIYMFKDASENGSTELDLLRGDERYKMRLANGFKIKTCIIISKGLLGDIYVIYLKIKKIFLRSVKKILPARIISNREKIYKWKQKLLKIR